MIFNQGSRSDRDRSLLFPSSTLGAKLPHTGTGASREHAAMRSTRLPMLLQGLQVSADRRFADLECVAQVRNRYETVRPNHLENLLSAAVRGIWVRGNIHPDDSFLAYLEGFTEPLLQYDPNCLFCNE